eukprot:TRINITY_DN13064_c0_g2_i1.p1 TRINITY_DN13064_c0_g2~~TRINITY_DN13064_c0_g2_i1.p1  ORF type:complete len:161 (+),score=0.12 TRINITY_DN13064_c0_g2_i1:539-1021(+)
MVQSVSTCVLQKDFFDTHKRQLLLLFHLRSSGFQYMYVAILTSGRVLIQRPKKICFSQNLAITYLKMHYIRNFLLGQVELQPKNQNVFGENTSQKNFCEICIKKIQNPPWANVTMENTSYQNALYQNSSVPRQAIWDVYIFFSQIDQNSIISDITIIYSI